MMLGIGLGMQFVEANRVPNFSEFNAEKISFWSQPDAYRPVATNPPADAQAATTTPAQPVDATPPAEPAAADAPESSAAAKAPATQPPSMPTTAAQAPATPAPLNALCLSVDDLSQSRYEDMQALLKSSGLDSGKCAYRFDKRLGWWVYWPPEYEAVRRQKVLESLHAAGVKDVFPITQGALAQAFSVGMFAAEGQALAYRNRLRSKGLDKIEYGPRPSVGSAHLGCRSDSAAQLAQLKASLPAWAKQVDAGQCTAPSGN
jgi:hypothetical protein